MKMHELARALRLMANALDNGPNVQLDDIGMLFSKGGNKPDSNQVAVNLHTLYSLSRIDKNQWKALIIEEFKLPLSIEPRDSTRNILGKLFKYLEEHPEAVNMLRQRAKQIESNKPSALSQALDILLKDESK